MRVALCGALGRIPGEKAGPKAGISAWIDFYNTKRFHRALRNRTPMAVQHDGAAALAGAGCGYVDNARALPTDPQQQQQTQPLAA